MLLFKAKFRAALLDGSKCTTLRSWSRRRVRAGATVMTNLGIRLHVLDVRDIALADLTDEHARADGFADRAALLAELRTIYGALPATLTLVSFRLA